MAPSKRLHMIWQTSRFQLDLTHPKVMGIVNVTPDSFSDGGKFDAPTAGMAHCEKLVADGADILDLGAESSRPGAPSLSAEEEWARLNPVLKGALSLGVPVSVDTCKTEVMRRALDMGADIVNDIRALMAPGALEVVASHASCGVCLMHMKGEPGTMQKQAHYSDVIEEVCVFLGARVQAVKAMGIADSRITLDPGVGFGKSPQHNLLLLARQQEFKALGLPLLLGWSRKSTLGAVTGRPVSERLAGSLAAALGCVARGASIVRVHDVAETVDALKVWRAAQLC
jgi:dihydropteroate synthase